MQTKAFLLVKNGRPQDAFSLEIIQLPKMEADDITIEVSAFGLNYADVMARNGLYRECPSLPTTIGYEVVGTVVAVGDEKLNHLLAKKVVAFTRFGGYAQHVITKEYAIAEIGEYDEHKALCLATQYVTAYYMTNYVTNVHPNENVLVHAAAGGVGTALIQLLKLKNARIIAKTGSDAKMGYLKELGVTDIINYRKEDYTAACRKLLKNERLDISFNPVAGATFKQDMKLLGSGGRMILFGGSERSGKKFGFFSTLNFVWKMGMVIPIGLMMRSKNILGVNMLKIADNKPAVLSTCLKACVELALEGKIDPQVGAVYENANLVDAHAYLESGESTGKVVVKW